MREEPPFSAEHQNFREIFRLMWRPFVAKDFSYDFCEAFVKARNLYTGQCTYGRP